MNITQKLALGIEYDGSVYCGWQKQKCKPSIQDCIESALIKITSKSIKIFCAGRTDSGVHALEQVIHFETDLKRSNSTWVLSLNYWLPNSICVRWVKLVNQDFHARFSAISRRYFYYIYNDYVRSAIYFKKMWHYKKNLNVCHMSKAAQYLLGENDFSAFQAVGCQSRSSWRNIHHLRVIRRKQCVIIDIKANAFLYRMVRNIVGSLVEVGCGNKPEIWILELLQGCKRSLSKIKILAPANGLYLAQIKYPNHFFITSKN